MKGFVCKHGSCMAALIVVICLSCTGAARGADTAGQATDNKWELVWSDEFNTPGLPDPNKWSYEEGYKRNRELQYYTKARPENARVEAGMLVIETRKDDFEGHPITSASLHTRDKASWRYGRIEVRAKLPAGRGMWPAIWMLGINPGERRDSREPNLLLIGPATRPGCA